LEITFMVIFQEPFWVGIVTRLEGENQSVFRFDFGAEPSDREVYEWILHHFDEMRFSPQVEAEKSICLASNPKRRQRQTAKILAQSVGTKSQQALQLAREEFKHDHSELSKQAREEKEARLFQLKQEKRKEKHRGH
jgi:hypothetical protein